MTVKTMWIYKFSIPRGLRPSSRQTALASFDVHVMLLAQSVCHCPSVHIFNSPVLSSIRTLPAVHVTLAACVCIYNRMKVNQCICVTEEMSILTFTAFCCSIHVVVHVHVISCNIPSTVAMLVCSIIVMRTIN